MAPAPSLRFEKIPESEVKYEALEHKEAWVRQCIDSLAPEEAALIKMFYYETAC